MVMQDLTQNLLTPSFYWVVLHWHRLWLCVNHATCSFNECTRLTYANNSKYKLHNYYKGA